MLTGIWMNKMNNLNRIFEIYRRRELVINMDTATSMNTEISSSIKHEAVQRTSSHREKESSKKDRLIIISKILRL
jgi:hypothetical protein